MMTKTYDDANDCNRKSMVMKIYDNDNNRSAMGNR